MEENNFEREVQKRLKEWELPLPDTLWPKIEAKVGKKNSRRWLLFLWLGAGLLLGGAALLILRNPGVPTHPSLVQKQKSTEKYIQAEPGILPNQIPPKGTKLAGTQSQPTPRSPRPRLATSLQVDPISNSGSGLRTGVKSTNPQIAFNENNRENNRVTSRQEPALSTLNSNPTREEPTSIDTSAHTRAKRTGMQESAVSDELAKTRPSNLTPPAAGDTTVIARTATPTQTKGKQRRWGIVIYFNPGISAAGSQLPASFFTPYSYAQNSSGPGTGPGITYTNESLLLHPGWGFSAGVLAEKSLTPHLRVNAGVGYRLVTFSGKTGPKNDTTGYFNANPQSQFYLDRLGYLEIPVSLKLLLGRKDKLPLVWQAGVDFATLLRSNSMQFNQGGGFFYPSHSGFSSSQWGLHTALGIPLFY
ncbi:MAG: hypothetical protein KGM98_10725, partial [Bacteroidota bacterium]|nr:hypothetical protein [Bacteroidota bacterium]